MILPADKENATVLMDKETYDNKIHMIISAGNYSVIRRDPTKSIERRIREKSTWTYTGDYNQTTMESEDKGKLPFLDVLVTRDAKSGIVQTAAYPPIQTGTSTMSLTTQPM